MTNILQNFLKTKKYRNFNIKAFLFDMDGVLYNSMPAHVKSWQQCLQEYGFKSTNEEEFYLHEGRTAKSTINIISKRERGIESTESEINSIYERKTILFNEYNKGETMPEAFELLKILKNLGFTIVLVSGSGQKSLLDKLENNFPNIFTQDRMVTGHDVKYGKPHPEPFIMGLEKAGNILPNEAIVIENAPLGIKSATDAGIFTIAINTGPLSNSILQEAGANIILNSIASLKNKISTIINEFNNLNPLIVG